MADLSLKRLDTGKQTPTTDSSLSGDYIEKLEHILSVQMDADKDVVREQWMSSWMRRFVTYSYNI